MTQSPRVVAVAVFAVPQSFGGMTCTGGLTAYGYAWQRARVLAAQAAWLRFDPRRN